MSWFDALTAIVVAFPATAVGAVLGWWLFRRSYLRDARVLQVEKRRNSVSVLSAELYQIKSRFEQSFPQFIIQAPYWERFQLLPTQAYDELRASGRVADMGSSVAGRIHHLYAQVVRANDLLRELNGSMQPMKAADVNGTYGELWREITECKTSFLRDFQGDATFFG